VAAASLKTDIPVADVATSHDPGHQPAVS